MSRRQFDSASDLVHIVAAPHPEGAYTFCNIIARVVMVDGTERNDECEECVRLYEGDWDDLPVFDRIRQDASAPMTEEAKRNIDRVWTHATRYNR